MSTQRIAPGPRRSNTRNEAEAIETEPRVWQVVYALTAVLLTIFSLMSVNTEDAIRPQMVTVVTAVLTLLTGALLVLTLRIWTGAFFLLLFQICLFAVEGRLAYSGLPGTIRWVALTMGILICVSRYRTLQERDGRSVLLTIPLFFRVLIRPQSAGSRLLKNNLMLVAKSLLRTVGMIICCVSVAALLLVFIPLQERGATVGEYRLQPNGYRTLMMGVLLFILFLPAWLFVNEIVWRTLSRRQAGVYLRSVLLSWVHRDLRMVINKRIKRRRARVRAVKRAEPDKVEIEPEGDF